MASKLRSFGRAVGVEALRAISRGVPSLGAVKSFDAETLRALMTGEEIGERCGTSYKALVKAGYERNVCILRAINEIAAGVASVPIDVFVNGEKVEGHDFATRLGRPNINKTKTRFFSEFVSYYQLDGNAFAYAITGPGEGPETPPMALQTLRPDLVKVERKRPGPIGSTVYTYTPEDGTQRPTVWTVSDLDEFSPILHMRTFSPLDETRGFAPLVSARSAIDRHNLSEEWNSNIIRNGARIPGVFLVNQGKNEGVLTTAERDSIREMVDQIVAGAKNSGRPIVMEGGLTYEQNGWSPTDIDWSGGKASAARDAVNALGFPPMLLGIPGDNTFSNQREARLALWENTIIPLLGLVLDELTAWLGPRYGTGIVLKPNLDQVPALALRRERTWDRVKGSDWLSVNEQRAETGLDKRTEKGADDILVSYAKVPLAELGRTVVLAEEGDPASEAAGADPADEPTPPAE